MTTALAPPPQAALAPEVERLPWRLSFGMKAAVETEVDGVVGLLTDGTASRYNVVDADGEHQVPGSFADVADSWGRQAKPMVLFQHGLDRILKKAPIGWGLSWKADSEGLHAKCFIPRDPTPPFTHDAERKTARYREIYAGIKERRIRHYSVGGIFERVGKALVSWSMDELTITARGCLGEHAAFILGAKAVDTYLNGSPDYLEPADPPPVPQAALGFLNRPDWTTAMSLAHRGGDAAIHDALLSRPHELQGQHNAEDCTVCAGRRASAGVKAEVWTPPGGFMLPDEMMEELAGLRERVAALAAPPTQDPEAGRKAALVTSLEEGAAMLAARAARLGALLRLEVALGAKVGKRVSSTTAGQLSATIRALEGAVAVLRALVPEEQAEGQEAA